MHVAIIGEFPEPSRQAIRALFPSNWTIDIGSLSEATAALVDADVVIPEHARVDAAFLDRAPRLGMVQTGAGFDNVDIAACSRRGVLVANAAGINAAAVAEHVMAFVLCWYKNLIPLDRAVRAGEFAAAYAGGELAGKTIGIVGTGHAGRAVAHLSGAFGMERVCVSIRCGGECGGAVVASGLTELLSRSDVVTLHCRLSERTRHLIGERELAAMRPNALLVNTSRGGVVDEGALVRALRDGRIAGAALDVFESEPLPQTSPLRAMRNVILTPHTAGMPDGCRLHRRRYLFFAENIALFSDGHRPRNVVNPEAFSTAEDGARSDARHSNPETGS